MKSLKFKIGLLVLITLIIYNIHEDVRKRFSKIRIRFAFDNGTCSPIAMTVTYMIGINTGSLKQLF